MPSALPRNVTRRNRLTSNYKVLEEGLLDGQHPLQNTVCSNCKQRHYLVEKKTDNKNLFCTHCGALTPIRSVKHGRGLAAPAIQNQQTAIAQPTKNIGIGKNRIPAGIHSNKQKNPLEDMLIKKGFQIIDSQYIEPEVESQS